MPYAVTSSNASPKVCPDDIDTLSGKIISIADSEANQYQPKAPKETGLMTLGDSIDS